MTFGQIITYECHQNQIVRGENKMGGGVGGHRYISLHGYIQEYSFSTEVL